jgi:hypothetical protein
MITGAVEVFVSIVVFLLALGAFVFWIWTLVECATKEAPVGNTKIVWVIIVAITGIIGALIYYWVRRPKRIAELGH